MTAISKHQESGKVEREDGARGDRADPGDGGIPGEGVPKPYKRGGELMFEAHTGIGGYLSVKWEFSKFTKIL